MGKSKGKLVAKVRPVRPLRTHDEVITYLRALEGLTLESLGVATDAEMRVRVDGNGAVTALDFYDDPQVQG